MKKSIVILYAVFLVFGSVGVANADPIVWDLGPTAGTPFEWGAANVPDGQNYVDNVMFSTTMSITGFHLFTSSWHGDTSIPHHLKFFSDDGTGKPGSLLYEFDVVPTIANYSIGIGYIKETVLQFDPITLDANVTYWVGASHIYNNAMVTISSSSVFADGRFAKLDGNNFKGIESTGDIMFQLEGTEANPVPEPATMLMLGSGLIGLVGFRRKFMKR